MSSGPMRRVSRQDIQLVQNLIERCLQLYMNQKEVVETLLNQAKIEPGFTELVWQKLEEENREFFREYYLRLMVKRQIVEFNRLLEQQVRMMQIQETGATPLPTSNGSLVQQMHQNPTYSVSSLKQNNVQHPFGNSMPNNAYLNGAMSLHSRMHPTVDMSAHPSRIEAPPSILPTQSSNIGLNGRTIKSEAGYSGNSSYMFGGVDSNVVEPRQTIGDVSVAPFSGMESNAQAMNEPLLEPDTSSFGFLGQIPRNFSLSDLTADFSQSSDILESYARSPFLATETDNFMDIRHREHQDNKRSLDTISEGLSYEDFGSDS
ncbi:uncharacterized protein LOC101221043 isoform X2 [Cucumis sativus]|uniref:uncharacterized protein LOC101221043 isoform X2 n=1 Tax=Cucumis sativus TaxID=3659 RepID=UPI0005EBFDD7|nr:uncharacterized protein LOC101221043 isoform X2 [Cucumis sativus]